MRPTMIIYAHPDTLLLLAESGKRFRHVILVKPSGFVTLAEVCDE